jgi:hypothetical protein
MIKVKQLDSIESVTDFSSGADHGISLRKFQEMNVPITMPGPERQMNLPKKSVFEDDFDFTATPARKDDHDVDNRWKFKGPWLAGITDGELQKYLEKNVRNRRPEFRLFLKEKLAQEINETAAQKVKEAGDDHTAPPEVHAKAITNQQLPQSLRRLRDDRPRLYRLVSQFLDLAPLAPPTQNKEMWKMSTATAPITITAASPYAQDGPPITHPSAGLSYLRTASVMDNHPFYGPQLHHAAVQARVVAPRQSNGSRGAKLGVGGFVTNAPAGNSTFNMNNVKGYPRESLPPGLERLDPNIWGGAKVWVEPLHATVNSKGQPVLTVTDADGKAQAVAREMAGEEGVFKEAAGREGEGRGMIYRKWKREEGGGSGGLGPSVIGSSSAYGLTTGDLTRRR